MKKFIFIFFLIFAAGCANVNPRLNSPIQNQNGKLEEIKNNQNGVIAEIGKLRQASEIQNSLLKEVQQGLLNINASVSKNENSGIQILQGDGSLILVFSIAFVGMLLYYYRDQAKQNQKAADLLASEVAKFNDPYLNDQILKSAIKVKQETKIYKMLINNP